MYPDLYQIAPTDEISKGKYDCCPYRLVCYFWTKWQKYGNTSSSNVNGSLKNILCPALGLDWHQIGFLSNPSNKPTN